MTSCATSREHCLISAIPGSKNKMQTSYFFCYFVYKPLTALTLCKCCIFQYFMLLFFLPPKQKADSKRHLGLRFRIIGCVFIKNTSRLISIQNSQVKSFPFHFLIFLPKENVSEFVY